MRRRYTPADRHRVKKQLDGVNAARAWGQAIYGLGYLVLRSLAPHWVIIEWITGSRDYSEQSFLSPPALPSRIGLPTLPMTA